MPGPICTGWGAAGQVPVSLPDVQGLWVLDAMLLCQLIQEVEQVLDSDGHGPVHAQDGLEGVIHELLQCALEGRGAGSISGVGPPLSLSGACVLPTSVTWLPLGPSSQLH